MASKNPVKRISAALGALDAADGPMSRLEAARRLREAAEELEAAQVEAARKAGATWIDIGACYGLTKQGAQQRFRAARNQAKDRCRGAREREGRTGGLTREFPILRHPAARSPLARVGPAEQQVDGAGEDLVACATAVVGSEEVPAETR